MPDKPYTPSTEYQAVTAFFGGVNSGLNPLLLRADQLAFATNATVRGGFITHRPPFRKMTLDFGGDADLQEAFETGFYQGGIQYRPDFGNHSLIASINGLLFKLEINGTTAIVTDISVPGDPNPPLNSQSWLWQAERWIIVNNGLNLPIFFDGISSRRSYGPSQLLGTVVATAPPAPPAIGGSVQLTMAADYLGPVNIPVNFNGALYQATGSVTTVGIPATPATPGTPGTPAIPAGTPDYICTLKNVQGATPGTAIPVGSEIYIRPSVLGKVVPGILTSANTPLILPGGAIAFYVSVPFVANLQVDLIVQTNKGVRQIRPQASPDTTGVNSLIRADQVLTALDPVKYPGVKVGELIPIDFAAQSILGTNVSFANNSSASVLVHTTLQPFNNPAVGDGVVVHVNDNRLGGQSNVSVWIGNDNYLLTEPVINTTYSPGTPASPGQPAIPAVPPSTTLYLVNLTDTSVGNYVLPAALTTVGELPVGRMGIYVMGRNWFSLVDGISFAAGNIVGGEGGTLAYDYRDSILRMTENEYLTSGNFRLPSSGDVITALLATAILDTAMGQGPLIVCTARGIFNCASPVDRSDWQDLTFPILTQSLLGSGALSQMSTFQINNDTFMRALDGWRSYKIARRNFSEEWGNTPITREMERVFNLEDAQLISFVSGMQFDNRALFAARPQTTQGGIACAATVALNLDPVSSISEKAPPVYDGAWGDMNVLQYMRAVIDSVDRGFAFAFNTTAQKIELWELLPTSVTDERRPATERILYDDDGTQLIPITWNFESSVLFKDTPGRPLLQLLNGEIRVADVVGTVDFQVFWKADNFPCWTPWAKWSICATEATSDTPDMKPGYQPRMGLGEPPLKETIDGVEVSYCDAFTDRPLRDGYTFQFKVAIRGHCKFIGMTVAAVRQPEPSFAKPICEFSTDPA